MVSLPGSLGFAFEVRDVLGNTGRQCTIMNFESLTWCSAIEFEPWHQGTLQGGPAGTVLQGLSQLKINRIFREKKIWVQG